MIIKKKFKIFYSFWAFGRGGSDNSFGEVTRRQARVIKKKSYDFLNVGVRKVALGILKYASICFRSLRFGNFTS